MILISIGEGLMLNAYAEPADTIPDKDCIYMPDDYGLDQRSFDESKLENIRSQKDYIYDRKPKQTSVWNDFFMWLLRKIDRGLSSKSFFDFWKILRYFLFALVIFLILSTLLKVNLSGLFYKPVKRKRSVMYETIDEDIHELNFDILIQEAEEKGLYRKAIRLYYLKSLKLLSNKSLIDWEINKTNREYFFELKNTGLQKDFKGITYFFDYIWYGHFEISKDIFDHAKQDFITFQGKINTKKKEVLHQ